MSDAIENEKPAKKPRKPRKPKAAAAAPVKEPKQPKVKALPCFVQQEGKVVTLSGRDVFCREMDAAKQAQWGVKSVSGALGKPCSAEPLVLTFKSPKAAVEFFNHSFNAESEDDEIIVAGGRTDWFGESIAGF